MTKQKINYTDYENIPLEQWNSTSFKAYLQELNKQKFGIPCVNGLPQVENKLIKDMCKTYGNAIVKLFIEEGVKDYKSNLNYPTVNFTILYKFKKQYLLPKLLKQEMNQKQAKNDNVQTKDVINYF